MDRDFKDILPMDYLVDKRSIGSYSLSIDVLPFSKSSQEDEEILKNTFHSI